MKHIFFTAFTFSTAIMVFGQVPASEVDNVAPSPTLPDAQVPNNIPDAESVPAIDLPISPLSDPNELLLIDGLDEEFEVLKLRDQDTNMILDMIQLITGRYILRPQNLPQVKITFDSMTPLTKRETLMAVESLLSMNGVAITKINDKFYKAVPAQGVNVHVPIWLDGPASIIKPSQNIYIKLYRLEYTPVEKMREILNPFATPNVSALLTFPHANSIMITDALINLQRMEKIIGETDKPMTESEIDIEIFTIDLNHTEAKEFLSKSLSPILKDGGLLANRFQVTPHFQAPDQGTKLTVVCHMKDVSILQKIIESLNVDNALEEPRSELITLYHADAEQVSDILQGIIGVSTKSISKGSTTKSPTPAPKPATNNATKSASTGSSINGNFSEFAQVVPDPRSNGIFIHGTDKDIQMASDIVEQLDKPLPMAQIDTIFVMVDISEGSSSGVDSFFKDIQWSKNGGVTRTLTDANSDGTPSDSETVIATEGNNALDGVLQVPLLDSAVPFQLQDWKLTQVKWDQIFSLAKLRNDVRIFSTPSLTVIHGGKGTENNSASDRNKIEIRDTRYVGLPGVTGTGQGDTRLEEIEAKTEMKIKNPRIKLRDKSVKDSRGTIFMSVEVSAEKFDETTANVYEGQTLPGKKTRTASTDLAVNDQEIMVLGGLREIQLNKSESKYNFLSNIPYVGEKLFTPKSVKYTPTELIIFIRPRLFDPESTDRTDLNTLRIDQTMKQNYFPTFTSPSGKALGIPDKAKPSLTDKKSPVPDLINY
jgi:type II secretory pathway component GspD/PulD (secretin)